MGWSIGFDSNWDMDVGYGVPAWCNQPECARTIDRGLAYVCGGEPLGGNQGCGQYYCDNHMFIGGGDPQLCERCIHKREPFPKKPDHPTWIHFKLTDSSWQRWRDEHPELVAAMSETLADIQAPPRG